MKRRPLDDKQELKSTISAWPDGKVVFREPNSRRESGEYRAFILRRQAQPPGRAATTPILAGAEARSAPTTAAIYGAGPMESPNRSDQS